MYAASFSLALANASGKFFYINITVKLMFIVKVIELFIVSIFKLTVIYLYIDTDRHIAVIYCFG